MGMTLYVYKAKKNKPLDKIISGKSKYEFRKYWFVYDYCYEHSITWENDEIAKIDYKALKDMVSYFDEVTNYQFCLDDEIMEHKDFLKRIKSLKRFLKDDEIIYFYFCY